MSTMQSLRAFIRQRLNVAVEEIIGMFERTITEYEEEIDRQRLLLTGVSQNIQPLITDTKIPADQQKLIPILDQQSSGPPCSKEEPEDMISEEAQQVQGPEGSDVPEFQFPLVTVKREDEENPQCALHQRKSCGNTEADPPASRPAQQTDAGFQPAFDLDIAGFLKATSDGQFFLSQCFKTESNLLDHDWNYAIESHPELGTQKDSEAVCYKRSHYQKKVFKCPACNKTFKQNTALQRHITCHTGERPFDCSVCGQTFRQKGSLHIHMRKHTGERPFSCLVCSKNFTQSGTLAAHMRIHTGEKPFSCSVCKKRCSERGTLVRHMRVHTGEKPFTCALCGKRFSEKGNLNKHERIHTGEKPFSCNVCEKKFSLLSHLKNHKCPGQKRSDAANPLNCPQVTGQLGRHIV